MISEETHLSNLRSSPTISKYMDTGGRLLKLYYPDLDDREIEKILDYSINKRYKKVNAIVSNNYIKRSQEKTLLAIADYIQEREPIVTAFGTMFKNHAKCPNPMGVVVQSFLDKRSQDKKMMFTFPKGSEGFEKYTLLQSLT